MSGVSRWLYPHERAHPREREVFDPIEHGARHGLSPGLSLEIWRRVMAHAVPGASRRAVEERFDELAARAAAQGGRLDPDVGKMTRVGIELERAARAPAFLGERSVPGRKTLVASGDTDRAGLEFDDYRVLGLKDMLEQLETPPWSRHEMLAAAAAAARPIAGRATAWREPLSGTATPRGEALWHVAERHAVTLYRRATSHAAVDPHDPAVEAALQLRGGGDPLPERQRRDLERELGIALDRVRIHTDAVAANAARAITAEAFTVGDDIFFADGMFAPDTRAGHALLVHELTHVAQGRRGATSRGLQVSRPGDALEQEADAAAARTEAATGVRPLDASVRRDMESAFGFDFHRVRIDPAASLPADVLAMTAGESIRFAPGAYMPGSPEGRRLLGHELSHVVQQSRGGVPTADAAALEAEADDAGHAVADRRRARVVHAAASGAPQFQTITVHGRRFVVGEVRLNAAARTDVRTHGNLLTSADQAHLMTHGDQLGYEASYTSPEDPYRWQMLKRIIDHERVDIHGIGGFETFPVKEVAGRAPPVIRRRALMNFMAGGITLPTLAQQRALRPGRPFYVASDNDTRAQIYYETGAGGRGMIGSNSLAHELFGHLGLASAGSPWAHGETIPASAGIQDPFGQPFEGSVNDFISHFAGDSGLHGPLESPTYQVGMRFLTQALADLHAHGVNGLSGNQVAGWQTTVDFDRNWIILSQNYRALAAARLPAPPAPAAGAAPADGGVVPTDGGAAPAHGRLPTDGGVPSASSSAADGGAALVDGGTASTDGGTASPPRGAAPAGGGATPSVPAAVDIERAALAWYQTLNRDQQWVFGRYLSEYLMPFAAGKPPELGRRIQSQL